jgi:hypothetical protein
MRVFLQVATNRLILSKRPVGPRVEGRTTVERDNPMAGWAHAIPSLTAAFLASLVEFVEALTVMLAVGLAALLLENTLRASSRARRGE